MSNEASPTVGDVKPERLSDVRQGVPIPKDFYAAKVSRDKKLVGLEGEMEDRADQLEERKDLVFLGDHVKRGRSAAGIELAHQIFLYGLPSGPRRNVPVRKLSRLATMAGVEKKELERHVVNWTREAMRIAREASPMYAFACSKEARATHIEDLVKMRAQMDRMEEALEVLIPGEKAYSDMSRLLIAQRKEWQDASGVSSGVKVAEAAAKLEAAALVKALGEDEEEEVPPEKKVDGDTFDC